MTVTPPSAIAPGIETADLYWQDGQPVSRRFGDVYFSRDNGLEETRYVFIGHNHLPERFAALAPGENFVVAESGFGTGLNFLATWQSWRTHAEHGVLHFVSVERYPVRADDIRRALAHWPELEELANALTDDYPPMVEGCHRLIFDGGRVRLTLTFGDALEAWQELTFIADAWFLDGFAPARNPELWHDQLVAEIRRHSRQGTTLATFTSVGRVRRALADAGFDMTKVPGFGRKREMLTGELKLPGPLPSPASVDRPMTRIAIVGAGIAGALLARNLASRGCRVTVLEQGPEPGHGASGNPQGALYVKLPVEFNDQARLALAALLHAQRFYPAVTPYQWHGTGLLMLASDPKEQDRQQRFLRRNNYPAGVLQAVDQASAARLTGVPCPAGGLWFARSGWLAPAQAVRQLLDHPAIEVVTGYPVQRLLPSNNQWCLSTDGRADIRADQVVFAAGHLTNQICGLTAGYRFRPIRGQITRLPATALATTPTAVITGQCYINPPSTDGSLVTGATFDLRDMDPHPRPDSHRKNLEGLAQMLPGLLPSRLPETLDDRVSFRCTTHDYQPVAGALTNHDGQPVTGVWMLTGFGSKGLAWGPLLAEFLADRILNQPESLPASLSARVTPERCLTLTERN